jgi:hypothetical protein
MFNSMNRTLMNKTACSPIALSVLALVITLLAACGGSCSTTSGGGAPPSIASGAGQVVISGAINKTYTSEKSNAVKILHRVAINVAEEFPCGVDIKVPIDMQSGTYPVGEYLQTPIADVTGEYRPDCGENERYLSTQGTLKLTVSGKKYSGTFEFTARHNIDHSKTIQVSGSFNDVSLP